LDPAFTLPSRVAIVDVSPQVDGGRYPAKATAGRTVSVTGRVFADGHEALGVELLHREPGGEWRRTPMIDRGNDLWRAEFEVGPPGTYQFTIEGWIDRYCTWLHGLEKRHAAGQDLAVEVEVGAGFIRAAAQRASGEDAQALLGAAERLGSANGEAAVALASSVAPMVIAHQDREPVRRYERELEVLVERERAAAGAWYEFFPRSTGTAGQHGTFETAAAFLPYVRGMGFDVVYLPPIHPIGAVNRKGPNNTLNATEGDHGSPWAIGAREGGHTAIHPLLGTEDDFAMFIEAARGLDLEVAMDIAFQCAPDHPWVTEHPEWFNHLPDGSIRYAENPPKKYEDIVPFDFECESWPELWAALRDVVRYWADFGIRIFRVDNPHTKPFAFWEWLIADVRASYPDAVFLSEAFTRPAVLHHLAKVGFSQSYTYFTWRNTRQEILEYVTELNAGPGHAYLRPNFWPNTPDILPHYLQAGGRPAFMVRLVLAAMLSGNYGIYGPAFELCEAQPREPGSEEYLNSEKYEVKHWDIDSPWSLREFITRVNQVRRQVPAFQDPGPPVFHDTDNERLLAFTRSDSQTGQTALVVVNLDPHFKQSGHVTLAQGSMPATEGLYQVHDLLGGARYLWQGHVNYVELDPQVTPAHIFVLRTERRTEHDFEYFL
jgi:starch synthase (maltosyl-transferring)